jgi:hypothetical protein
MLEDASTPICVGIYAKWGHGKTFLIQLIKKHFDRTCIENKKNFEIIQWFEFEFENNSLENNTNFYSFCYCLFSKLMCIFSLFNIIADIYAVQVVCELNFELFCHKKIDRCNDDVEMKCVYFGLGCLFHLLFFNLFVRCQWSNFFELSG